MTTKELKEWALDERAKCVLKNAKAGRMVQYGNFKFEVAGTEVGMVKIYDEPPSKHTDLINPKNLTLIPLTK